MKKKPWDPGIQFQQVASIFVDAMKMLGFRETRLFGFSPGVSHRQDPKMTGAEISVAGLRRKVKEEVLYLGFIEVDLNPENQWIYQWFLIEKG